jgi:hypothetical protein
MAFIVPLGFVGPSMVAEILRRVWHRYAGADLTKRSRGGGRWS